MRLTTPSAAPAPPRSVRVEGRTASAPSRGWWAFADQAVVSLANFAAWVLVGRYTSQEALGFFALGYSTYLFASGMARAMIWAAYTRRQPQLGEEARLLGAGSATVHLVLFAGFTCLLVWCAAGIAWMGDGPRTAVMLAVVGPAAAAMLLREHVRRISLARLDFHGAFLFDFVVSIAQVGLLAWLAWSGRMSAVTAFGCLATTSLLAVPWMLSGRAVWRVERASVVADWRANWSISKWLSVAGGAVLLGNQGYRWLLAAVFTIAELGRFGAAQIVVQVTNPLVIGGQNYLGPTSARVLAEEGVRGLWRHTVRSTWKIVAVGVAFLAVIALVGLPCVQTLYPTTAADVTTLLLVTLAAGALSEAALIPIEFAMLNLGHARLMCATAIVRLVINLTVGFSLVSAFRAEAIGVGMCLGSAVALACQWAVFAKEARDA